MSKLYIRKVLINLIPYGKFCLNFTYKCPLTCTTYYLVKNFQFLILTITALQPLIKVYRPWYLLIAWVEAS